MVTHGKVVVRLRLETAKVGDKTCKLCMKQIKQKVLYLLGNDENTRSFQVPFL